MNFRVQVWKRVWKMEYFSLKLGQDLGNRVAHPYQEFRGVPPTPPPPPPPGCTHLVLGQCRLETEIVPTEFVLEANCGESRQEYYNITRRFNVKVRTGIRAGRKFCQSDRSNLFVKLVRLTDLRISRCVTVVPGGGGGGSPLHGLYREVTLFCSKIRGKEGEKLEQALLNRIYNFKVQAPSGTPYSGIPPYGHLLITATFFGPAKRPYIFL